MGSSRFVPTVLGDMRVRVSTSGCGVLDASAGYSPVMEKRVAIEYVSLLSWCFDFS